ncbi:MAG: right-handed parallel beta-helix repeat-containing protein [Deltaproteobacteria bacterium]|nr:right-handed parallel beta-helix repeat-containing protein [Deltaproteobacteria bacterium]
MLMWQTSWRLPALLALAALHANCTRAGFDASADAGSNNDVLPVTFQVEHVFSVENSNWNSYVDNDGATPVEASGVSCDLSANGYNQCVHGGERRKVVVPNIASCAGLSIEDALGLFDWLCCDDIDGTATFYTTRLASGKGLRDLVHASGFHENSVTVRLNDTLVSTTTPKVWGWTNPVQPLPDNEVGGPLSLDTPGGIYVLDSSRASGGYVIDGDGISVVALRGGTLSWNDSSEVSCPGTTGADRRALICAWEQDRLWIEGDFTGGSGAVMAHQLLHLAGSRYSVLNQIKASRTQEGFGTENAALRLDLGSSRLTDIDVDHSGGDGLSLGDTHHTSLVRVRVGAARMDGIYLWSSAHHNRFNQIMVTGSRANGIVVEGNNNTFLNTEASSNGTADIHGGFKVAGTENRLFGVDAHNNFHSGLLLYRASGTTVVGGRFSNNGSSGVRLMGFEGRSSLDNTLVSIVSANNAHGIYLNAWDAAHKTLRTIVSHASVFNNSFMGLNTGFGDDNLVNQMLSISNAQIGVALHSDSDNNVLSQIASGFNSSYNIDINGGSDNNRFTQGLLLGGTTQNCHVAADSSGLIDGRWP